MAARLAAFFSRFEASCIERDSARAVCNSSSIALKKNARLWNEDQEDVTLHCCWRLVFRCLARKRKQPENLVHG